MIKPKIEAKQAVKDIRAGLDDAALMKKYNLSSKGLHSLYGKLMAAGLLHSEVIQDAGSPVGAKAEPAPREVSAKDAIVDIKAGMSDEKLMGKYKVSATGLQNMFEQLLDAGLITENDLEKGKPAVESTVDISPDVEVQAPPLGPQESQTAGETTFPATVLLDQPEMDVPVTTFEKTIKLIWECPACGQRQPQQFDKCPECGVVTEEYLLTEKAIQEDAAVELEAEPAEDRDVTRKIEADLRKEVEKRRELEKQKEPEEQRQREELKEPEKEQERKRQEAIQGAGELEQRAETAEPEELEVVDDVKLPAEVVVEEEVVEEEEIVDVGEEMPVPRVTPERIIEKIWTPLDIDPVVDLSALKSETETVTKELRKELFPAAFRLARALSWIAYIQLVLIIIYGVAWIAVIGGRDLTLQALFVYVLCPLLLAIAAYVLLRGVAAGLRVATDTAIFQAKSTVLLTRVLQGLNRRRGED